MKRILLTAVGALGAAGMIAMAAPASAAPAQGDPVPSDPRQFQQYVQSQLGKFGDSVDPGKAVDEFLNGNCGENLAHCDEKDPNPGVLHQFDYFRQNLEKQSKTLGESIGSFVKGIPAPPGETNK